MFIVHTYKLVIKFQNVHNRFCNKYLPEISYVLDRISVQKLQITILL